MTRLFTIIAGCLMALFFNACRHVETIEYAPKSDHTLLIYMAGDNSLSQFVASNLRSISQGILESEQPINVVIFKDERTAGHSLPVLFQLRKHADSSRLDTIYIKHWKEEVDSSDPKVLEEVITTAFTKYDTQIKGIEFWSHGLSWIPANNFQEGKTRAAQYINMDGDNCTELWEIRQAIEQSGVHFDYMMFDACHMATAEVGYELRNVCDYILASPTEIMGDGFPYRNMIRSLSAAKDHNSLLSGLYTAYEDFHNSYLTNGTFSLLRTEGFEHLYQTCLELEQAAPLVLSVWKEIPQEIQKDFQYYGRSYTNARYYFYDVQDWADHLAKSARLESETIKEALKGCVLLHYNSPSFIVGESISLNHCCGLAMSVPQFWKLSDNKKLDTAYSYIQWNL